MKSSYGYTETELLDQIQEYGQEWLLDCYKSIREDEYEQWILALAVAQTARTPQSKKGAKAMKRYMTSLESTLERTFVPWVVEEKRKEIRDRLHGPPRSVVIAEGPGPDLDAIKEMAKKGKLEVREVK